jgi:hypothetical protein
MRERIFQWLLALSCMGLFLPGGGVIPPAWAASPFDGDWHGANCYEAAVAMKVTDGLVRGTMTTGREVFNIAGKIAADGTFNGGWLKGQFSGTSFKATYTRTGGAIVTDAGKQCLVTAERGK